MIFASQPFIYLTITYVFAEIWGHCTNGDRYGCVREGRYGLLPPVMSGKIKSKHVITYGKVTVRAKIPKGDWIWPGKLSLCLLGNFSCLWCRLMIFFFIFFKIISGTLSEYISVASITQLLKCVIEVVTFKGGHPMWYKWFYMPYETAL